MNPTNESESATFVITLPEEYRAELAYRANARTTHGVLVQLIAEAHHSLVLAAPYMEASALLEDTNLATALCGALERGIHIDLVSTCESLRKVNLQSLRGCGPGRLRLFQPAANYETMAVLGSHAKFYIADGVRIYVGSANLSYLGLNQHLEMGVLLQGEVAQQIYQFWQYLCEIGFFVEINNKKFS